MMKVSVLKDEVDVKKLSTEEICDKLKILS